MIYLDNRVSVNRVPKPQLQIIYNIHVTIFTSQRFQEQKQRSK